MSRLYEVTLRVKGIAKEVIENYLAEQFGADIDMNTGFHLGENIKNEVLEGTTGISLCVGMMENEAHSIISAHFKSINPKALVQTQWVDLEDLPYEEYGDTFDEE